MDSSAETPQLKPAQVEHVKGVLHRAVQGRLAVTNSIKHGRQVLGQSPQDTELTHVESVKRHNVPQARRPRPEAMVSPQHRDKR